MQGHDLMNIAILKQILLARRIPLIVVAILFAVTFALQMTITYHQQPKLESLRSDWLKQRSLDGRGAHSQDRESIYKNGMSDLARFRERFYPKSQFARFIGELYATAGKNDLEVVSITFKPTIIKDEQLLQYALSLSLKGKYLQLKKFIYELNRSGNLLHVDSISFVSQGESSETVELQVQITSYFTMEGR